MSAIGRAQAGRIFGLERSLEVARREAFEAKSQVDLLKLRVRDLERLVEGYRRNWNASSNEVKRLQAQLRPRPARM